VSIVLRLLSLEGGGVSLRTVGIIRLKKIIIAGKKHQASLGCHLSIRRPSFVFIVSKKSNGIMSKYSSRKGIVRQSAVLTQPVLFILRRMSFFLGGGCLFSWFCCLLNNFLLSINSWMWIIVASKCFSCSLSEGNQLS
jgi:hypothetical protein